MRHGGPRTSQVFLLFCRPFFKAPPHIADDHHDHDHHSFTIIVAYFGTGERWIIPKEPDHTYVRPLGGLQADLRSECTPCDTHRKEVSETGLGIRIRELCSGPSTSAGQAAIHVGPLGPALERLSLSLSWSPTRANTYLCAVFNRILQRQLMNMTARVSRYA